MRKDILVAAACAAGFCANAAFANPMEGMKGKMKAGMYETKMTMDMAGMPGMPKGMSLPPQASTFKNCVTDEDIKKGTLGKKDQDTSKCEIKDFNMSGNTASYKMVCPDLTAENKVTFSGDSHVMDTKMAMKRDGQMMNVATRMESRYLGPCPK